MQTTALTVKSIESTGTADNSMAYVELYRVTLSDGSEKQVQVQVTPFAVFVKVGGSRVRIDQDAEGRAVNRNGSDIDRINFALTRI